MNYSDKIIAGDKGWNHLAAFAEPYLDSGIFILVDENTQEHCLPLLTSKIPFLSEATLIRTRSGDNYKNILTLEEIWTALAENHAFRSSLLLCLGGGVISDLGGFAAATFKRGMHFALIPTTLLAMVDAGLGGKTGINLNGIKNQVGVFAAPAGIYIFPEFLGTLPVREKLSGYAEMIKHAMIDSETHFEEMVHYNSEEKVCNETAILKSASVKVGIVNADPLETGLRKILNFGHTIGHACEAWSAANDSDPLTHGEAVAVGLICESFISMRMLGFGEHNLKRLSNLIQWHFPHYKIMPHSADAIIRLMYHDKKNVASGQFSFALLSDIGKPAVDQAPSEKLIRESLHFYANLESDFFA